MHILKPWSCLNLDSDYDQRVQKDSQRASQQVQDDEKNRKKLIHKLIIKCPVTADSV